MKLEITQLLPVKFLKSNVVGKWHGVLLPIILEKFGLSLVILLAIPITPVGGQIVPDESLNTDVEQQGVNQLKIDGGAREGNNLFHSFETFSIPEGIEAVFENASDIQNIFTRVTASEASAINGILKTQGGANFFLINKNGIVFGENARLDVGGSFVATTANSIQFADGTEFATSVGEEEPILTVSVPIGLQFEGNSGGIEVNGAGDKIANDSSFSPVELNEVDGISLTPNKTLALIGNGIDFTGGAINSEGSQVYLVSLNSGRVNIDLATGLITSELEKNSLEYRDIDLVEQSLISIGGEQSGNISLIGKNINFRDASFILNQSQDGESGGAISLKASESLTLAGNSADGEIASGIRTEALGNSKGGDINIAVGQLSLQDAARIQAFTFSDAEGGSITITSDRNTNLDNSFINASTRGQGNAGNLELSTSHLKLTNVGIVSSSSIGSSASGDGGRVTVKADVIDISGGSEFSRSNISTSSFTTGNGGDLQIDTAQLIVTAGASISSSSFNDGDAGNLTINASESIDISGENPNFQGSSNSESTIRTAVQIGNSSNLPQNPQGNAGNLSINTPVLNIDPDGIISVENEGTGDGGDLSIKAKNLNIDQGQVTAETQSGVGGDIYLNTNFLQLDENSSITATAGNDGNGGNIIIGTSSLIAKKNSEITANAFEGRGGNIDIEATEGLFLFDSPENIFSASSQLGIDGSVKIETPDINLQPEVEQLTLELFDTQEEIANSCLAQNSSQGSFNVSKNGNAPKNPNSNYSDLNYSLTGIGSRTNLMRQNTEILDNAQLPAENITTTPDGRIFLVAAPQNVSSLICK